MIKPHQLLGIGIAASLIGHGMLLGFGVLFADVRPYGSMTQAISVDIVTPDKARPAPEPVAPPMPPQPELDLSFKTAPTRRAAAAPAQHQAAPRPQAAQQPPPAAPAAAQPPPAPSAPSLAPAPSAAALPGIAALQAQEPDITQKYNVMVGLPQDKPGDGFDARAARSADIATTDIAAFRRHLKGCAMLPAPIAATDKVRIVMRVLFKPDGTLAAPPLLIEASASAKGPELMQSAVHALQACQPYAMLPADKYNEWKMLDLSFTPQDFTPG